MPARLELQRLYLKLADDLLTQCGPAFWFVTAATNGKHIEGDTNRAGHAIFPIVAQKQWARDLLTRLNRHVDFDGSWIVAWSDPVMVVPPAGYDLSGAGRMRPIPARCSWLHKDADGDVNFVVDTEDSLTDILRSDLDERVQHAAIAHQEYRSLLKDVGIDKRNMRKAALGQAPTDPRIRVVPFTRQGLY